MTGTRDTSYTDLLLDLDHTLFDTDGSELLVWSDGETVHAMSVGGGSDVDVVALASTLRSPTDEEWERLAESVTG